MAFSSGYCSDKDGKALQNMEKTARVVYRSILKNALETREFDAKNVEPQSLLIFSFSLAMIFSMPVPESTTSPRTGTAERRAG